jgi:hypothetical protein
MKVLATSLVALMMATAANAATVSYDASVGDTATGWAQTLNLPQFNPALGTLTKVTLTLFGQVDGSVSAQNNGSSTVQAILKLAALITADVAGATLFVDVEPFDEDDPVTLAPGQAAFFESSASETDEEIELVNLMPFIGIGDIMIDLTAKGTSSASGGGNMMF